MATNFIFELLQKHSRDRADEIFLEHIPSGSKYTYGEVFDLVRGIIHSLDQQSQPESLVLLASADLDSVVAYCGIVSSGRTAVVIDDAVTSVYKSRLLGNHRELCIDPTALIQDASRVLERLGQSVDVPAAHQIETVLFTSGSTGEPKIFGVPASRPGSEVEFDSVGTDYAVLNFRRPSTTPFRRNLRRALLHAGRFLTVDLTISSASVIDEYLSDDLVREMSITPTMVRTLFPYFKNGWTKNVCVVHLNGERTMADDLRKIFEVMPQAIIRKNYGLTEFGQISDGRLRIDDLPHCEDPITVGIPNISTSIRDVETCEPLPSGEVGNIFVKNASGYQGTLLEKGLFEFQHFELDEWIDTGDRGFFNSDNELVVLGRTQETLKIRGSRVSLLEVEEIIRSTGLVDQVLVASYLDFRGRQALGALVVSSLSKKVTLSELRQKIVENHSLVMCPTRLMYVDAIPVLASGKLDRVRATKLLIEKRNQEENEGDGATFKVVTDLVCKVLGIQLLPAHVDFFEAGLDSLGSLELLDELSQAFGMQLDIRVLLENPTCSTLVGALANYMEPDGRVISISDGESEARREIFIFWVLPGANPYMIKKMASEIPDFSHRGVLHLGSLPEDVLITDVNVMVQCLAEAVATEVNPGGTLVIGGFSSAGIFASELAVNLMSRGISVQGVILLDPAAGTVNRTTNGHAQLPNPVHLMLGREGRLHALDPVSRDHALFGLQVYALDGFTPHLVEGIPVLHISSSQNVAQKSLWDSHPKSTFVTCEIEHLDYLRKPDLTSRYIKDFLYTVIES